MPSKKQVLNNPKLMWPSQRRIGTAKLRCGGEVEIIEYRRNNENKHHPHEVRFEGYHLVDQYWCYDDAGGHGQGTGCLEEYPFDILEIKYL